jgi:hypothetical protein
MSFSRISTKRIFEAQLSSNASVAFAQRSRSFEKIKTIRESFKICHHMKLSYFSLRYWEKKQTYLIFDFETHIDLMTKMRDVAQSLIKTEIWLEENESKELNREFQNARYNDIRLIIASVAYWKLICCHDAFVKENVFKNFVVSYDSISH